jgi:hypothetical protein
MATQPKLVVLGHEFWMDCALQSLDVIKTGRCNYNQ